jgi:integrase
MTLQDTVAARASGQAVVVRLPIKPSRVKLTSKNALALPGPGQGDARMFYDLQVPGLALMITSTGHRTYIVTGRTVAGRSFRLKLGTVGAITVADARRAARAILGKVALGHDPAVERREAREAHCAARQAARAPITPARGTTIREAAERFLRARERTLRPSTWWSYKSVIERLVLPELGEREIASITAADLDRLHEVVTASAGPVSANRCRAIVSALLAHAGRPGMTRGTARHREAERERVLDRRELAALLAAARARGDAAGTLVVFLVLTACRRGEAVAAKWQDVDLDRALWRKPASSTKSGRAHSVPLAPEAIALLRELGPGEPSERVFGCSASALQRAFVRSCAEAGIVGARVHDLRRTSATMMAEAGAPLPVVGKLLGHAAGSTITAKVYARSTSAGEVDAVGALGSLITRAPKPGDPR